MAPLGSLVSNNATMKMMAVLWLGGYDIRPRPGLRPNIFGPLNDTRPSNKVYMYRVVTREREWTRPLGLLLSCKELYYSIINT
jgi:hypothetical protein